MLAQGQKSTFFQSGIKRCFDIVVAVIMLIVTAPLIFSACSLVKLSSKGPVIYRAERIGKDGLPFKMFKIRTMHCRSANGSSITSPNDRRVFLVGRLLRATKVDELTQFVNILLGDMSVVGPRPEAPDIVEKYYEPWMLETLLVKPGITSPGAIFGYQYSDKLISDDDPESSYVEFILKPKLALERAYMTCASFSGDFNCLVKTFVAVIVRSLGLTTFMPNQSPIILSRARLWCSDANFSE